MVLFKVPLSEQSIQAYQQPKGTRNPECGGGMNCTVCTLKMLGIFTPGMAESATNICTRRIAEGRHFWFPEITNNLSVVLKLVRGLDRTFVYEDVTGNPADALHRIAVQLEPGDACVLVYGSSSVGHVTVLYRNLKGGLELIDPQRGLRDEGTPYGFTEDETLDMNIELTPNYYRVRGEDNIAKAIIAQSVKFKYYPSKDDLLRNIASFKIGTLSIDSPLPPPKMEDIDMRAGRSRSRKTRRRKRKLIEIHIHG